MNVDDLLGAIDRIKDSPFAYGVLVQAGQALIDGVVTEVIDVRGNPLGLLEEPLCDWLVDGSKIICHGLFEGQPIPGHVGSPPETKPFGDLFA